MINVIGDSHVNLFTGKDTMMSSWSVNDRNSVVNGKFKVCRLGALTASALKLMNKEIFETCLKLETNKGEWVILSFGEVDCRAHLTKDIIIKGRPEQLIGICVDEYVKYILELCNKGYKIAVLGVPPSHVDGPHHDVTFGNNIQRNYIARIWNNYLESLISKYRIPFLVVFDEILIKDTGYTNSKYMDGWVHMNQKCWGFMEEELKKLN